ncbi:MAG: hypothetical protein ACQKBT_11765, partial [Puniceicoccales bacterium]
ITATGELLDSDPETEVADDVDQPHWTGVWDSDGTLLSWLVSGNEGISKEDGDFVTPLDSMTSSLSRPVESMYSDGSVKVPVRSTGNGSYAYWIGDEGVKAKQTLAQTVSSASALVSAQRSEITKMEGLEWLGDLDPWYRERAITSDSLEGIASTPTQATALEDHRYDLTASSYGVLSNVVNGGLKQDLTLSFFHGSSPPSGEMFDPIGVVLTETDPGGPLWSQLQSWATTGVNENGYIPVREQTDNQVGFFPIVTLLQVYLVPRYQDNGDGTASVFLHFLPAVTLWNPYNQPLEESEYYVTLGKTTHMFTSPEKWYYDYALLEHWKIFTTPDSSGSSNSPNTAYVDYLVPQAVDCRISFSIPSTSLAPGESKTFSVQGNRPFDVFEKAYPASGENELTEGFYPSGSFYYDTGREVDISSGSVTYQIQAHNSLAKSFTLVRRIGGNTETIAEAYYLAGGSSITAAETEMLAESGAITNLDGSVGLKLRRTFVADNDDSSIKWLANYNPRAMAMGPSVNLFSSLTDPATEATNNPSFSIGVYLDGDSFWDDLPTSGSSGGVGYSNNPAYVKESVLFEVSPGLSLLQSVGQLMHAPLYNDVEGATYNAKAKGRQDNGRFDNLLPAYPIGNSLASPYIPLDATYVDWSTFTPLGTLVTYGNINDGLLYDYSYYLNESLWDDYFFSALPSAVSRVSENPRLVAMDPDRSSTLDSHEVASEFLVDGAFNINSASEDAWRALLGAFYGENVDGASFDASPILRILENQGDRIDVDLNDVEDEVVYHGYRDLSREQIANLAKQIVKQVKWSASGRERPFTSLADFVNRDPDTDAPAELGVDAFRLSGALSRAIQDVDNVSNEDLSELGIFSAEVAKINAYLSDSSEETSPRLEAGFIQKAQEGWRSEGVPGWLTQADLLARFGSVISARSDTFKIRVRGESQTGGTSHQVWAEAIVQRIPDYIDSEADQVSTAPEGLSSQVNREFGRRFIVVDFQWIESI